MISESSDGALVDAWRSGDARAGEALFERYYDSVARFFLNKTDATSAQDLVQRSFLACLEGVPRLLAAENFRSYLFGIAYRLLCKHYEGRARELGRNHAFELSVADLAARTPTQMLADRDEQRLLLVALRAIPLEHQVLLELLYWEKLPVATIAAALQIPENTAKTRLRRARQLLEQAMDELSDSPELKRSTFDNLERWAADLGLKHRPARSLQVGN